MLREGRAEQPEQGNWHARPLPEVFHALQTSADGLSRADARRRLEEAGPNTWETETHAHPALLLLKQLRSPLVYMLLAAAALSAAIGHVTDTVVILVVVVLNTVVGFLQEWRAEKALAALRQLAAPVARVLRDGQPVQLRAPEVVPGDLLLFESGDRVAADVRLLEAVDLRIDESSVTGESTPVEKTTGLLPPRTALGDRANMAWTSTHVLTGRGRGVAVATGGRTMIGQIAREVQATPREQTPLQIRLARVGTLLGVGALGLAALVFLLGLLRGIPLLTMLLFAVAAAVAAIPEGLPAVISVVLALGVQRMARCHAIIRRLPAVETLGSTSVICTDKTGTLTRNEMTVERLWAGGLTYQVTGEGYAPVGELLREGAALPELLPPLAALLRVGVLANTARLEETPAGWRVQGDPTEGALLVVAQKAGIIPDTLLAALPRRAEIPFSSQTRMMASLHADPETVETFVAVKGAPGTILARCTHILAGGRRLPLSEGHRAAIHAAQDQFGAEALRVLAGAYRLLPAAQETLSPADVETALTFVGLWGMADPPRPEARDAVRAAQGAGIRVVMVTGDHAATAAAIARQVGIAGATDAAITGVELEEMDDAALRTRLPRAAVFARVSPGDKFRLVSAFLATGAVVAVTGDGVNDAPALKRASIGIAMGQTGTEVAKEAADMVLTDDNFATIVNAITEGRVIYGNLQKVVFFLITTNLGEMFTLLFALGIGASLPLTAVMILWVNLVTDGLCTLPLGVEPPHANVLEEPPRSPRAELVDTSLIRRMVLLALVMASGTLGLFLVSQRVVGMLHARTIAFTTLVAFQWFHAFNARSRRSSLWQIGFASNRVLLIAVGLSVLLQFLTVEWPPMARLFGAAPLTAGEWGAVLLVSSSILIVEEVRKAISRRSDRQAG